MHLVIESSTGLRLVINSIEWSHSHAISALSSVTLKEEPKLFCDRAFRDNRVVYVD